MKKMLNIALVAVATIATVSTVEARQRTSMQVSTTNLGQATKQALNQQSADIVLDALQNEPQTVAEQNTIILKAKEKDLMDQEELVKKELKNIRSQYSWLPFRTSAEIQKNYNDTKAKLSQIQAELTNVRADLKVNMKETSRSWQQVAAYAVGAALTLGVTAAGIYKLYGIYTEKPETFFERAKRATLPLKPRQPSLYERGTGMVSGAVESTKGMARRTYEALPSLRRQAVTPSYNLPEYQ